VIEVSKAIGMDSRIGSKFLNASVGFGGSCFQKDILNLVYISKSLGLNEVADYWHQVILMNIHQRDRFSNNILKSLYNTVAGKKITLLGWAFKKDTNDTRESASIYIANNLIEEKANISIYDPKVANNRILDDLSEINANFDHKSIKISSDVYVSCEGAHAIAIITEWDEFITLDWSRIYQKMNKPAFIFDGRNILDKIKIEEIGFIYKGIGN